MRVNQMATMNMAYRSLMTNQSSAMKSLQRIATGYKINSAADDAAGLAISEKMRAQIRGLSAAQSNAQMGLSAMQTADGAMSDIHSSLNEMYELAVKAGNGTYTQGERDALNAKFQELMKGINFTVDNAQYNGMNLIDGTLGGVTGEKGLSEVGLESITASGNLNGSLSLSIADNNDGTFTVTGRVGDSVSEAVTYDPTSGNALALDFGNGNEVALTFDQANVQAGNLSGARVNGNNAVNVDKATTANSSSQMYLQIGANAGQTMGVSVGDVSTVGLGLNGLDISSQSGANAAIDAIKAAKDTLSSQQSVVGATETRLESTINSLATSELNLTAAESTIRDTDMAKELMNYFQKSVQAQAAQLVMAQLMQTSSNSLLALMLK